MSAFQAERQGFEPPHPLQALIAQWLEHSPLKRGVEGSSPSGGTRHGDCSSAVERLPVEEDAMGSNPISHPSPCGETDITTAFGAVVGGSNPSKGTRPP